MRKGQRQGGRTVASFNKGSEFSATILRIKTFSITTLSIIELSIMTLSIMESIAMLSGKLCFVSFTLSVTFKPFMLSVIVQNVVMLSVVTPNPEVDLLNI
jgi:hypothetical protein